VRLLHFGEERPGVILPLTAHVDLNQRVKSDLVRLETSLPHGLEEIVGLEKHLIDGASFKQSIESNLVRLCETLDAAVENLFYERDSTFHVSRVNTRIN